MSSLRYYILIFALLFSSFLIAQESEKISNFLNEKSLEGFTKVSENSFQASGLWGYMNGGADLYLEYGCENLDVLKFKVDNKSFKVELFRMDSPLNAFGIFSINTHKCDNKNCIDFCDSRYQIQRVIGDYYISIINSTASESDREISKKIDEILVANIKAESLELPFVVADVLENEINSKVQLFVGRLGLENKGEKYLDLLRDLPLYQLFVIKSKFSETAFLFTDEELPKKEDDFLKIEEMSSGVFQIENVE